MRDTSYMRDCKELESRKNEKASYKKECLYLRIMKLNTTYRKERKETPKTWTYPNVCFPSKIYGIKFYDHKAHLQRLFKPLGDIKNAVLKWFKG